MKYTMIVVGILALLLTTLISKESNRYNTLTSQEANIILKKGTERPFSGRYNSFYENGVYRCKQCDQPLFNSSAKFDSKTGWPSFDDNISGAVETKSDFSRKEIICSNCKGHLGHVFYGEGFTSKNTRHCVNSLSLSFVPDKGAKAYFAGGCFWGVEFYLEQLDGVIEVTSGFMGGDVQNPSYKEVIKGRTGHVETVEVLYDPSQISYSTLAKRFFEIHDPTQVNGQGPDIGSQYFSKVFVLNEKEHSIVDSLIAILERKLPSVATEVVRGGAFYAAEKYHQNYYKRKQGTPYCHRPVNRFGDKQFEK